jgi:hypothetical protein
MESPDMGDEQAEQSGLETGSGLGSPGAGSVVPNGSDPRSDRLMASAPAAHGVESPTTVPDQGAPAAADNVVELKAATTRAEMPKAEPFTVQGSKVDVGKPDVAKPDGAKPENTKPESTKPEIAKPEVAKPEIAKPDMPKGDAPRADGSKADALKADIPKPGTPGADNARTDAVGAEATHLPGQLQIMSGGERAWTRSGGHGPSAARAPKLDVDGPARGRRYAALAAMLALAVIAGAAGGALATVSLSHSTETADAAAPPLAALETLGRIDAEITALKAGLERNSTAGLSQVNKTGDRLERIEKAQAEATAKLARLGESIDKLRTASSAAATPVVTAAPKDITGTVTTPAGAQPLPTSQLQAVPAANAPAVTATTTPATAPGNAPTTTVGRLPTVEGWVLREASRGSALIEGRSGLYEVFAGDPVPGLGRVDAIRKQDGRWVVVTSKGLIVAR